MATAEITVKYADAKKEGKKNATIKTDSGQLFFVPPEMFHQFEPGGRYNIQYKVSSIKGLEYRFVESVTKMANGGAAAAAAAGPSPQHSMSRAKYGTVDMETAERIFVCGAINALCGNQNVDPRGLSSDDLIEQVNKLRSVWGATFGNPQKSSELDDEIPF